MRYVIYERKSCAAAGALEHMTAAVMSSTPPVPAQTSAASESPAAKE